MTMNALKHLISIKRLNPELLFDDIIPACIDMIPVAKKAKPLRCDNGLKTVLFFDEHSTRTRMSFAEAVRLLGWHAEQETLACNSRNKKESWMDTLMMWHNYNTRLVCTRTHQEGVPLWLAEMVEKYDLNMGIINAGDGRNQHPTQTILDLVTIQQKLGRLHNFKIGFVGDLLKSRTAHSLLDALRMCSNISVVCVAPENVQLPQHHAEGFANFIQGADMELLRDCDVINVLRWQVERIEANSPEFLAFLRIKQKYQINKKLLEFLKPTIIILHALPIDQEVEEIAHDIMDDSRVIPYQQSWFGPPSRMAVLQMIANNLLTKISFNHNKVTIDEIKNIPLDEALIATRNKQHDHFIPLKNGTVIDHLEPETGIIIRMMLKTMADLHNGVITVENKSPKKDIIVIKEQFLPKEIMTRIAGLSPGVTFNIMQDGRFRKIKIKQEQQVISGIGTCLNPNCVTRSGEPGIQPRFINEGKNSHPFGCDYCGQHFTLAEILPLHV